MRKITAALLCLAGLSGCASQEPPQAAARPSADVTLRIGLIPEQDIFRQLERYGPLARYLSRKSGVEIELKILPRYGNILDNFRTSKLDGAFFGSFTYVLAHEKLGVEVVARPVGLDNASTYYGMLFVRKDSGIRRLRDMKGKRFAFVDKATTAGYLLPLEYFSENGVTDYKSHFAETYFSGTHEDAIRDVLEGRADAGAAKNTVFERIAAMDPRIRKELLILETSPRVPENGLALGRGLDAALTGRIRKGLLGMHMEPEGRKVLEAFGALRFIETNTGDYDPVYRYARRVGLNLSSYDYRND